MEAPPTGHCDLKGCNMVDFLPIQCPHCKGSFCKDHSFEDNHECATATVQQVNVLNNRVICAKTDCVKPTEVFATDVDPARHGCPDCKQIYCLEHRHAVDHSCDAESSTANEPSTSKSKLQTSKVLSSLSKTSKHISPPTDPAKRAKFNAIEAMKMRRTAEPANPRDKAGDVPLKERVFVSVEHSGTVKPYWLRKDIVTGRAVDLLAARFSIHNLSVSLLLDGNQLVNSQLLASQVADGSRLEIIVKD